MHFRIKHADSDFSKETHPGYCQHLPIIFVVAFSTVTVLICFTVGGILRKQ